MIAEPDVALTDYGLAVESAILCWLLYRIAPARLALRNSFIWFYISIGLAAVLGGTFHGFFSGGSSLLAPALWRAVMLMIGGTALTAWRIGALLSFSSVVITWIMRIAILDFVVYSLVILLVNQSFAVAIVNYLPAVIFLTISFGIQAARGRDSSTLIGTAGLLLTFVAAGVQHAQISLHPQYFNHNAVYHLIQGIALLLIFISAHKLVAAQAETERNYAHHQT